MRITEGGRTHSIELPNGEFMSTENVLRANRSKAASVLDEIPGSPKSNVGFMIENDRNLQRRKQELHS